MTGGGNSWSTGMDTDDEHQQLRELLGSFALGHLDDTDRSRVRAHLDGCASCSADLAEIEPLAGLLDTVDPARFSLPALPPGDLGALIRSQVAGERRLKETDDLEARRALARRRTTTRTALGAVAAAVALIVLVSGVVLGRSTAPDTASPAPAPATITVSQAPSVTVEPVELVGEPRVRIESAGLVAHSWGVELRMTGRGFEKGEVFAASFRNAETGDLETAGAFVGTGRDEMTCNLQSALMRAQASEVVVTDSAGDVVVAAQL